VIDKALQFLSGELQTFLRQKSGATTSEQKLHLTSIMDNQGQVAIPTDTMGMSVVGIEEERINKSQQPVSVGTGQRRTVLNPEVRLKLYLLFAANFTTYSEGLKFLSYVVAFFQAHTSFDGETSPDLDPGIEHLRVDLESLTFEQQNHIWAALGANYLPSVLYTVRLITIQEQAQVREATNVQSVVFHRNMD
jgi:hypothetical protein